MSIERRRSRIIHMSPMAATRRLAPMAGVSPVMGIRHISPQHPSQVAFGQSACGSPLGTTRRLGGAKTPLGTTRSLAAGLGLGLHPASPAGRGARSLCSSPVGKGTRNLCSPPPLSAPLLKNGTVARFEQLAAKEATDQAPKTAPL
jgi:hypothetical protein